MPLISFAGKATPPDQSDRGNSKTESDFSPLEAGWAPILGKVWSSSAWDKLGRQMRRAIADHGDTPRWQKALNELTALQAEISSVNLSGLTAATTQIRPEQQTQLEETLLKLHPWRKGPWRVHGIHLDTEWRCDWKWQRLQPHLPNLSDARILDVGSGNGYYGWQMLKDGARSVIGIDPTVLFVFQHAAMSLFLADEFERQYPQASNAVLPLRLEDLPPAADPFDLVFSMGVLYHRKDHLAHLRELREQLRPGGTLVLETLVCEQEDLIPSGRYARMRNVHMVPKPDTVSGWLAELGFERCELRDLSPTTPQEQRSTPWMTFESLKESLDPSDQSLTLEGHPAPVRASFVAHWSP